MTDTGKRLVGPVQLANAAATVYTVPAATTANLLYMRWLNEDVVDRLVTVSIGADGAGKRIFRSSIAAGGLVDWNGFEVMATGEILQAYADAAGVVTMTTSGVEVT